MKESEQDNYRRILIVDDNEAIHRDFDKILSVDYDELDQIGELDELDAELFGTENKASGKRSGFELSHATQGKDALKFLQQRQKQDIIFGAAFVDMRMPPGWDGVETIEHLWKIDPDLQVVICTAYSDHSWEEISERLGYTDKLLILKKPFDTVEVVQLATSLCEKRRLLDLSKQQLNDLQATVGQQAAELKSAHQSAENLLRSISSALISLDASGYVSHWNQAATEVLGVSREEAIGKPLTELPIEWNEPELLANILSGERDEAEIKIVSKDGDRKTLNTHVTSIVNDSSLQAKLIVMTDITHQTMLKSQLDQALRLEAVGQLAAGVAHEINTPMQYIGDNVRYVAKSFDRMKHLLEVLPAFVDESVSDEQLVELRRSLTSKVKPKKVVSSLEQIPEALSDSIEGVDSVARIVAAMKEFSHPGGDEKSHVGLNAILESTITVARNEWKYVADIQTEFDDNIPKIPAYGSELNQAFLNIVVNASHAINDRITEGKYDKGKIELTTSVDGDCALVTIRDTGGGIPPSIRERVFEPFFTTKEVGKGTGQGLAIAHSVITKKHNGSLTFEVEEGQGTTFSIRLPLQCEMETERLEMVEEVVS